MESWLRIAIFAVILLSFLRRIFKANAAGLDLPVFLTSSFRPQNPRPRCGTLLRRACRAPVAERTIFATFRRRRRIRNWDSSAKSEAR